MPGLENDRIKKNLLSGKFKIAIKKGRSKVWDVYGKIEDNEGVELENKLGCIKCFSVLKYDGRSTSNLVKHKCYTTMKETSLVKLEVNKDTKEEATKIITQWCIGNCRPFQLVQDSGLISYSEFLISVATKYGGSIAIEKLLPHPITLSRNVEGLYDNMLAKIQKEVHINCKYGYGLTTDLLTDNYLRKSYMSLAIHFIKNGQLVTRLLGLNSMDSEEATGK